MSSYCCTTDYSHPYTNLHFYTETEIDITMDSFNLFLPSESSYQDTNALCHELVANGDAEGNGFNPYPMTPTRSDFDRVTIVEEDGNKFWRLSDRYTHDSSVNYQLESTCLTKGTTYRLSNRARFHIPDDFQGTSEPYFWMFLYRRPSDGGWSSRRIVDCDAQSVDDGWVECSGEFMMEEDFSLSSDIRLRMSFFNSRDGARYDVDLDDISIQYVKGYVDEFVVDSDDVSCWGSDADIHVTTSSFFTYDSKKRDGILSKIQSHIENDDGTTNVQLIDALTLPIISVEEDADYAVELALISRNIKVEGANDENNKGGYMQVLHTPNITQQIQGIEFFNMGRMGEFDRFVSDQCAVEIVSNSIRVYHSQTFSFCRPYTYSTLVTCEVQQYQKTASIDPT